MLLNFKNLNLFTILLLFIRKTSEFRIRNISTNEYIALLDPVNGYPLVDYNAIYDTKKGDYILKIVSSGYVGENKFKVNNGDVNLVMSKKPLRFRFGKLSNGFIRIFSGDNCAEYENGKVYLRKCVDDLSQLFNFEGNCVFCDRRREAPGSPDDIHILPSDPPVTPRMLNEYAEGIGRFKFEPKPKNKNIGAFTLNIKAKPGNNQNSGSSNQGNYGYMNGSNTPQLRYVKINKTSQLNSPASEASEFLNISEDSEFSDDRDDDSSMKSVVDNGNTVFPNTYNPSYAPIPGKPIAKGSNTYILNPPDFGTVDPDESPINKKPNLYQLLPSPGGPPTPSSLSNQKTVETQATISIPQKLPADTSNFVNNIPKVFTEGPLAGQKIDISSVYEHPKCPAKDPQKPLILKYTPPMASITVPLNFLNVNRQDQFDKTLNNLIYQTNYGSQSGQVNQDMGNQSLPNGAANSGNYQEKSPVTSLSPNFNIQPPPAPKGNSLFKGLGLEPPKNEVSPIIQKPTQSNPIQNWKNFLESRLNGKFPFAKNEKIKPKPEPLACPGSPGCPDNPTPPGAPTKNEPLVCPGSPGCPDNPITPVGPVYPEKSFSPIVEQNNDVNKYLKPIDLPKLNPPEANNSFFGPATKYNQPKPPTIPSNNAPGTISKPKITDRPEIVTPQPKPIQPEAQPKPIQQDAQPTQNIVNKNQPGIPKSPKPPESQPKSLLPVPGAPQKQPRGLQPLQHPQQFFSPHSMGMQHPLPMPSNFGMPPPLPMGMPSPHMMMMGPPSISMAPPMMMGPPSMGISAPCGCTLPPAQPIGSNLYQCPCSQR
ncbi:Titin [Dictyocoela muelleri]|nr:Titin [Dictyocoela muelleri]